jgi:hypothetical protein
MKKEWKYLLTVLTLILIALVVMPFVPNAKLVRVEESVMTRIEQPLYYTERSVYTVVP